MRERINSAAGAISLTVWLGVVAVGFSALAVYSNTPGEVGAPPSLSDAGPLGSILGPLSAESTNRLVMAIHPRCPCTRASVAELDRLIARCGDRLACSILVYRPSGAAANWHETGLLSRARRLPRTEIVLDSGGVYAKTLRLNTSGAVVVYDRLGNPAFWGGVTAARGHEGDSPGSAAIQSLVRTGAASRQTCSVYGCALVRPTGAVGESLPRLAGS